MVAFLQNGTVMRDIHSQGAQTFERSIESSFVWNWVANRASKSGIRKCFENGWSPEALEPGDVLKKRLFQKVAPCNLRPALGDGPSFSGA